MNKVLLLILDGLGLNPNTKNNAFAMANTPNLDQLFASAPWSRILTHGPAVGLPQGQMGNSEVGHITIGSGRVVLQELPRINLAIEDGSISQNPLIGNLHNRRIHLLGLASDGGVHSDIKHLIALHRMLCSDNQVYVHAITDGRDVAPKSAASFLELLAQHNINPASISGRFYAMDRDQRWQRTEQYYQALMGNATKTSNMLDAINKFYEQGKTDEFFTPTINTNYTGVVDGDVIITTNFRADRMRQICHALSDTSFTHFPRTNHQLELITMTEYSSSISQFSKALFAHSNPKNTLGEVVANHQLKQLRVAETEKYAHVTYFFNGGAEAVMNGEERVMIPSPKVETYDLQPEMSVVGVTDAILAGMNKGYDLIVSNFANCDMVGHSGSIPATIKAVESVDLALGRIMQESQKQQYHLLITADHGNAEEMYDDATHQPLTSHTTNPVPCIYFGGRSIQLRDGELSDIAPTVLQLLQLEQPQEMTGRSLINEN